LKVSADSAPTIEVQCSPKKEEIMMVSKTNTSKCSQKYKKKKSYRKIQHITPERKKGIHYMPISEPQEDIQNAGKC